MHVRFIDVTEALPAVKVHGNLRDVEELQIFNTI
jgi:hypothetical protein